MLDLKFVRANFDEVKEKLSKRGEDLSGLDRFLELDERRRQLIGETETLKSKRNEVSKQVAEFKREKKDADHLIKEMREVGDRIKAIDEELRTTEEDLNHIMLTLPNLPHESVPVGETEDDNVPVRHWGDIKEFSFEPKAHWDLATDLDIVDFERAAKVTGSRFAFYKGAGRAWNVL